MANFTMKCSQCGAALALTDEMRGQTAACPKCGSQFQVPELLHPEVAAPARSTASLVLGILGLVFFWFCGLGLIFSLAGLIIGCIKKYRPGIILGIIGVCLAFVIVIVSILTAMLLPALSNARFNARSKAREISCVTNQKQIVYGILAYAADHNDSFPAQKGTDGLELVQEYFGGMLQCPSGSNHYLYIGEGLTNDASYFPILLEMPGNHRDRVNVGFSDGHVETIAFAEDAAPAQIIEQLVDDEALKAKLLKNLEYYNKNNN